MKHVLVLWIAVLPLVALGGSQYRIFEENGKVGIKNDAGEVVIPAAFEALGWSDGHFSLAGEVTGYRAKNLWGLINLKKEFVTEALYEDLTYPGGDRVVASKRLNSFTVKKGFINLAGKVTVPFRYDGISVSGLRAIVFTKNGTRYEHGLVTLSDVSVLPLKYKSITSLGTLRYAVQNFEGKIALFSEEGTALTSFVIDSLSSFHYGYAIMYQNYHQGLLNRNGEILLQPTYRAIEIRDAKTCRVKSVDKWYTIDNKGIEKELLEADMLIADGKFFKIIQSGKTGLMNEQFKTLLPPVFDYVGPVVLNKVIAKKQGRYGLVTTANKEVLPFQFDSLVVEGRLVRAKRTTAGNSAWTLFDTLGVEKSKKTYDWIGPYNGKFFPVRQRNFWGAMNAWGVETIHCVYDSIVERREERVKVKFKGNYGVISLQESWVLQPQKNNIRLVNDEVYLEEKDGITFLKSYKGETIYFTSNPLHVEDGYLIEVVAGNQVMRVSLNGQIQATSTLNEASDQVFTESEGYRGILRDGKYGFVDARGRLRIANRYEGISYFKEGLAAVKIMGKWGFVDAADHIVINPSYEHVTDFQEGKSIVTRNGKKGMIKKDGSWASPARYSHIEPAGRFFILTSGSLRGVADHFGNVLIEPRFNELQLIEAERVLVRSGDNWGVLSTAGMSILPIHYDHLIYLSSSQEFLAMRKSRWQEMNMSD